MILHCGGTFIEPDGSKGTYEVDFYETLTGEVILGATFSIPTVFQGTEVPAGMVLEWGMKRVLQASALRRLELEEVYRPVAKMMTWMQAAYPQRFAVTGIEPKDALAGMGIQLEEAASEPPLEEGVTIDQALASLEGTPAVWLNDVLSRYTSEAQMLESFWPSAPDISNMFGLKRRDLSVKPPYTKEFVTLNRAFLGSAYMVHGWRQAIQNACTNQGVGFEQAIKVADHFIEGAFDINPNDVALHSEEPHFPLDLDGQDGDAILQRLFAEEDAADE